MRDTIEEVCEMSKVKFTLLISVALFTAMFAYTKPACGG